MNVPNIRREAFIRDAADLMRYAQVLKTNYIRNMTSGNKQHIPTGYQQFQRAIDAYLNKYFGMYSESKKRTEAANIPAMGTSVNNIEKLVISYDDIRPFIFNDVDYRSPVELVGGFETAMFQDPDVSGIKLREFTKSVIQHAFITEYSSPAELTSSLNNINKGNPTQQDVSKYLSIRNQIIVKYDDRTKLYNSVTDALTRAYKFTAPPGIYIEVMKLTIDFCVMAMVYYAARCYILAEYFDGFSELSVATNSNVEDIPITECVGAPYTWVLDADRVISSNIASSMDELIIRDITRFDECMEQFKACAIALGISEEEANNCCGASGNDKFYKTSTDSQIKLIKNNEIYSFMFGDKLPTSHSCLADNQGAILHELKRLFVNPHLGFSDSVSCKDALLTIIKSNGEHRSNDLSKDVIRQLARNLICIAWKFGKSIWWRITDMGFAPHRSDFTQADFTRVREDNHIIDIYASFYEDLMFTIAQKFSYLEQIMSDINAVSKENLEKMLTLNVPAMLSNDTELEHATKLSTPYHESYLFELEAYHDLSLYDESLRMDPQFANIEYLSEAGGADLFNKVVAIVQGLIARAHAFFRKDFAPASKWVMAHKAELDEISKTYRTGSDGKASTIQNAYDYKLEIPKLEGDITVNGVDPYAILNKISNVNVDEIAKDPKIWIKGLYPDKVGEWFDDDPKTAAVKYRNKILFNVDSDQPVQRTTLPNNDSSKKSLEEYMNDWVTDITMADGIAKMLESKGKALSDAIGKIKQHAIVESVYTEETDPPAQPTDNKEPEVKVETNKPKIPIAQVTEVVDRTCVSFNNMIIEMMRTEYGYIQKLYRAGKEAAAIEPKSDAKSGETK